VSTGGGTGQPHTFRCSKCRLRRTGRPRGYVHEVDPTGRVRSSNTGIGGPCVAGSRYQYRCTCCGHLGWSRHLQLARKCDRLGIPPHPDDATGHRRFQAFREESSGA